MHHTKHAERARQRMKAYASGGTVKPLKIDPQLSLQNQRAMDQWGERADSIIPRGIYRGTAGGMEIKQGDFSRGERKNGGRV